MKTFKVYNVHMNGVLVAEEGTMTIKDTGGAHIELDPVRLGTQEVEDPATRRARLMYEAFVEPEPQRKKRRK